MIKDKSIKNFLPEILTLCLYMIFMSVIMYFHEPWYDEAQAWLIARDASMKEILFELPHYEGHPPIWHLILLPFAKLGAPYELSLKFVSLAFSSTAMGVFIFKSPFKRKIKLLIPFTYFFFYQYGVISRPYCVMMLGFVLAAVFYKEKDEKPFCFVLSLAIICSSSAYGIVLACGICIVWIIEIFKENLSFRYINTLLKQSRFKALSLLFVYNTILVVGIIPAKDTYAVNSVSKNINYFRSLIYSFFILPGDATILDIYTYNNTKIGLDVTSICGIIGSTIISVALILYTRKKGKLLLLLLPYSMLALFFSFIYFYTHHIGIVSLFFMFIIWCCKENKCFYENNYMYIKKIIKKESDWKIIKVVPGVLLFCTIIITIFYSVVSSVCEIFFTYGEGRSIADFIKNNNLTQYEIIASWSLSKDEKDDDYVINASLINNLGVLPYFEKNIFENFNKDIGDKSYTLHKNGREEKNIKFLLEQGQPDIIIGYPEFNFIVDCKYNNTDYECVHEFKQSYIWKGQVIEYESPIYIRKKLLMDGEIK